MSKDEARLMDILLACREARQYVEGVTRHQFSEDKKLQRALSMVLEIIGEAARAISDDCKTTNPQVPWRDLVSLRNRIIHEYFRFDLRTLWEIVQRDVPALEKMIEPLVPKRATQGEGGKAPDEPGSDKEPGPS